MTMTLSVASQEDEREAACYANSFRQARFKRLLAVVDDILAKQETCRILDVGGWTTYWQFLEPLWRDRPIHITLVNLTAAPTPDERFSSLTGDARDLSQLARFQLRPGAFEFGHRACRAVARSVQNGQ